MLKGKRVTLRTVEREDLKALHEMAQHVELVMLADDYWNPIPFAKREKNFEKYLDDDDPSKFVIVVDTTIIGSIGLHTKRRQAGSTSLGIAIYHPDYLGKGYGREAIGLLLDWAFRIQNWRRVWLQALATNERAIRSYRACGFVHEGLMREDAFYNGQYVDVVVMGMLRSEWDARHRDE